MNRYRSIPGMSSQQKATSTTLCQKCLKKGHYSYECKATAQERPYISRPSRTQQLADPKLIPRLNSDIPNDLARKAGVADEQLAKLELQSSQRRGKSPLSPGPESTRSRKRSRSLDSYSSNSVSTISTNRSLSPKRARTRHREPSNGYYSGPLKRRYSSSVSSRSRSRSSSSEDPEGSNSRRSSDPNQRRRHQLASPEQRGRLPSQRRGSRRTRSRSNGLDMRRIVKERKSMTPAPEGSYGSGESYKHSERNSPRDVEYNRGNPKDGFRCRRRNDDTSSGTRQRSLSPWSKRQALTQKTGSR